MGRQHVKSKIVLLLNCHVFAVPFVCIRVSQSPDVHMIGCVRPKAAVVVAEGITIGITVAFGVLCNVGMLHL